MGMMEIVLVGVLVAVAALYLLRRALAILRPRGGTDAGCAAGCGCGAESERGAVVMKATAPTITAAATPVRTDKGSAAKSQPNSTATTGLT